MGTFEGLKCASCGQIAELGNAKSWLRFGLWQHTGTLTRRQGFIGPLPPEPDVDTLAKLDDYCSDECAKGEFEKTLKRSAPHASDRSPSEAAQASDRSPKEE